MITFDASGPVSARTRSILVCAALISATSCVNVNEQNRCNSPDNQHAIVQFEVHGGGAAGFSATRIALVKAQSPVDAEDFLFEIRNVREVRFEWVDARHLIIGYPEAGSLESSGAHFATGSVSIETRKMPVELGEYLPPGQAGCFYSQDS